MAGGDCPGPALLLRPPRLPFPLPHCVEGRDPVCQAVVDDSRSGVLPRPQQMGCHCPTHSQGESANEPRSVPCQGGGGKSLLSLQADLWLPTPHSSNFNKRSVRVGKYVEQTGRLECFFDREKGGQQDADESHTSSWRASMSGCMPATKRPALFRTAHNQVGAYIIACMLQVAAFCEGDNNRALAQEHRGGTAMCFTDNLALHAAVAGIVAGVASCSIPSPAPLPPS